jgi:hypothetical protein
MFTSPTGLGPKIDSAGKAQYQLYGQIIDPPSCQGRCPTKRGQQISKNIFHGSEGKIGRRPQVLA